jgi:hypothetical protein
MPDMHTHQQTVASDTWTIIHNLATTLPVVDVFVSLDGALSKMIPKGVVVISNTTVQVTFSEPRIGSAAVR